MDPHRGLALEAAGPGAPGRAHRPRYAGRKERDIGPQAQEVGPRGEPPLERDAASSTHGLTGETLLQGQRAALAPPFFWLGKRPCGSVAGDMIKDGPDNFAPITEDEQEVLLQVVELLRKLRFGTVLLVVQDGRVVQIEMAEKIRLR